MILILSLIFSQKVSSEMFEKLSTNHDFEPYALKKIDTFTHIECVVHCKLESDCEFWKFQDDTCILAKIGFDKPSTIGKENAEPYYYLPKTSNESKTLLFTFESILCCHIFSSLS